MSTNASPAAESAVAPAAAPPRSARREVRRIGLALCGAVGAGALLQTAIAPGPRAVVATAVAGGALVFTASHVGSGRWRDTLSGLRFASALLFALAAAAAVGTLVVQGKPAEYYPARYGPAGELVVALGLDDVFHSLPFGALLALLVAALASSAVLRFRPSVRHAGFLVCHAGILATLAGSGASAALAVKGRIDLHAGADGASRVRVVRAGAPTGEEADLGFAVHLDRFDLVNHDPEFRVAYYEAAGDAFRLAASFAPEPGVRHVLPGGASYRIVRLDPDAGGHGGELRNPAAVVEIVAGGTVRESPVLFALRPGSNYTPVPGGVLVFERRAAEAKSFVSHVTLTDGAHVRQAQISPNRPVSFRGWTLYQAGFDPLDPTYSGLEAVRDPGVPWVFGGFALVFLGVCWTLYGNGRLERGPAPSPRALAEHLP